MEPNPSDCYKSTVFRANNKCCKIHMTECSELNKVLDKTKKEAARCSRTV